jgi:penicillin-binding protein 1C
VTTRRRIALALAIAGVAALWLVWTAWWHRLRAQVGAPDEVAFADAWHDGVRILDRRGALIRELPSRFSDEHARRGRPLALDEIGSRVVRATLVSEDAEFFEHDGIDRAAIARAFEQNVRHARFVSGASTITQQLVKLLDARGIPGDRDLDLKLREAARAQNLEEVLSKDEILVEYLNRLPYGRGLVGPEAAARAMFGVASRDLSWAQAALLAVLPRAPSYLDPYEHLERAQLRQHALLHALHEHGDLDDEALARALAEPIELRPITHPFFAPHFVAMLDAEDRLPSRGVVQTTLDLALQDDVEGLVDTHLTAIRDSGAHNAAAIVVDNATGEVLAWIGSADPDDVDIDGAVDMVRARRQPGSTLKPFVVAAAFAKGHTPNELVADVPTDFVEGGGSWTPANFHGDNVGPIALREALAASLNVPLVRLAADVGPQALLDSLRALGFASLDLDADHYGLSIALGTGEVELRELAAAYVTLARGGESIGLHVIDGEATTPRRVIDEGVAAAVTDALADPTARLRLLEGRSPFDICFRLALKTGTSSGYRDAWTVGYTRERTVAVWIGNADGSATNGLTGAGGAGPLFADIMRRAMLDVPTRMPLLEHDALEHAEVCPVSGNRPSEQCPDRVRRAFVKGAVPQVGCTLHVNAKRAGIGADGRARWECDPEAEQVVVRLPEEFSGWLAGLADGAPGSDAYGLPWVAHEAVRGCDDSGETQPKIVMTTPVAGSVWPRAAAGIDDVVELAARVRGGVEIDEVEFVIDGKVVATSRAPFVARVAIGPGDHEVYARPRDREVAVASERTAFSVR